MSGARAAVLRGGLIACALVSTALGGFILIAPELFFGWSWVSMGMDYNPHLLLDFGAMNLALAVPLWAAAAAMTPVFVRSALASFAVWTVAHFLIHLRFRAHMAAHTSVAEANLLLAVLGAGAVASIALLLLSLGSRSAAALRGGAPRARRRSA